MSTSDSISPQLVDKRGRLWQERTVIVRREDNGFGFTLTQEMPVFVDKVFNGSSAQKAGIHPKDRIIKVNGVSVVGHKHQDVVDMIKDSSHVTLTVISKVAANGSHRTENSHQSNIEISPPRQLQELTLQSLKTMLHKQRKNYESLSVDYSKQRTEKLEKELRDTESIIRILEVEIASKSPAIEAHIQTTSASIQAITPGKMIRQPPDDRTLRMLGIDVEGSINRKSSPPTKFNSRTIHRSGDSSPTPPNRAHTFSNGTISSFKQWKSPFSKKMDESDEGSDDDLSDEVDGASEAGPFSSLQELKGNPAHMSVFLHYLFMSRDPKYLLFYLVASSYQTYCKSVEMLRQRGMDIYWTFFLEQSPLQLEVDDNIKQKILNNLEMGESESRLKSVFVEARESLSENIIKDLGNYRHKRVLGLAGMFGDQMVTNQMPLPKQLEVATNLLTSDLKTCLDEKSANLQECIKNQAIASCMATFLQDVLTQGNKGTTKLPSILEKVQSFTRMNILQKKGKQRKKIPTMSRSGHTFQLTSYKSATNCDLCGKPLWGVVYHGYQCCFCEINIHRFCCIGEVAECAGQAKGKPRAIRKPSTTRKNNVIAVSVTADDSDQGGRGEVYIAGQDGEEDNVSPPADASAPGPQGDDVVPVEIRQNQTRAVPEPKQNLALPMTHRTSIPAGEKVLQNENPRPKADLTRTQSERLQDKPESALKQRSFEANTLSWAGGELSSAEEAQLGSVKPASSDTTIEGKQQLADEDIKELLDDNIQEKPLPWALVAPREVVQSMKRYEVARQENIRELVYTERTHLHKLKMMKYMYKIPLQKQNILTGHQVEQLFPSLEELILFHSGLCADLKERVGSSSQDSPIVKNIADVLLQRFDGAAGERLCHACSVFASNQAKAEKLVKEWKRKNERFRMFLKSTESHVLSQRLTLTELMPIAWTRLTRCKLLIENIFHSYKKHWDDLDEADKAESVQVETAMGCVKSILKYVNKQVKKASSKQKLSEYQSKMDTSAMEKSQHPIAQLFKNLDLTSENRVLIHEGPLTWRIQHRKVLELHALLLTDVLVLLEKHEDKDKYYLRTHTVESVSGTKEELSTVIRLKDCLLRTAAADRGGRTFLLVNNSNLLKLAQMYEFIAENPREKKMWEDSIERAMLGTQAMISPELPSSPIGEDFGGRLVPLGLSTYTSHLNTRGQLDKIDDDMKKLMNDKLEILRSIQVGVSHRSSSESTPQHSITDTNETPKSIIQAAIEQTGEITSTVSHIMVPNPTKSIVAETQSRLTDIIHELQRNLSRLIMIMKDEEYRTRVGSIPSIDLIKDGSVDLEETRFQLDDVPGGGQLDSYNERLFAIGEEKKEEDAQEETSNRPKSHTASLSHSDNGGGIIEEEEVIVAPPDRFSADNCATPTPGDYTPISGTGLDSGTSTPRSLESSSMDNLAVKLSPLTSSLLKIEKNKPRSPNVAHSLHESHSTEPVNSSSDDSPLEKLDHLKLSIAPRDSPIAMATTRVLSILSSSQHNLKPSEKNLSKTSSEEDNPDYTLTSLHRGSSTDSESNFSEGTNM